MSADLAVAGRYERKFVVRDLDPELVEHAVRVHPAHFGEIYGQRFVNNCYFDSLAFHFLRDAVQGHPHRLKVRIRWYGELFGQAGRPVLELKRKIGPVGTKESFPVPPFTLDRERFLPDLAGWFEAGEWPEGIPEALGTLRPALINRYSRRYFATPDRRFRLTLDTGCEYYPVLPARAQAHGHPRDPITTIVELKYATGDDDAAAEITSALPFRLTKSSKYVNGMLRIQRR